MAKNLRRLGAMWILMMALVGAWAAAPIAEAERVQWLKAEIARHDELYFKKHAPEITDAEYDALKRELRTLEKGAATTTVGDDRSGAFKTRRHREPMLSLEKAYTQAELRGLIDEAERTLRVESLTWVVEPKFDGLAISLVYEQRKLVAAVTRGNGREGDDVIVNVLTIAGIPKTLPADAPDVIEVRGEIFIEYAEFERINAERVEAGEELFAHPRNLAAGTLKTVDAGEVAKRRLRAVFYGLGAWEGAATAPLSEDALLALLRRWELPVVDAVSAAGADEVWAAVEAFGRTRAKLGFPTDGVVIKVNARAAQRELGAGETAPRWAMAYKFAPERVTTRLKAITLQVGRTGAITPVAELEPVKVGGTTVARATLHNADEIARRDLRVGDWVFVERAGEVIPAITGVDLDRREAGAVAFVFPEACMECATKLVREGAAVRCPNGTCAAQVRKRVEFFASRAGVGIGGLGPGVIAKLSAAGKLGSVADLYRLKSEDGVSERVLAEIERSRTAELGRLITGLGFAGVGRKKAEGMAENYGSLAALAKAEELSAEDRALVAELVALGVGVRPAGLLEKK